MAQSRRSHYDVTNSVNISSPRDVRAAVTEILQELYPESDLQPIRHAFDTFARMYAGVLPGYHGCDTWYHDAQHSLDCTLAMARLIDGHERRMPAAQRLGERRALLGIVCALFHDVGYIRRVGEEDVRNGAEFTLCHVTRGGEFLEEYLPTIGFAAESTLARQLLHFTGYEIPLDRIPVDHPKDRCLGFLLGTADIVAQMADRCYLEKCRRFLYHEFEACGLAGPGLPGGPSPIYSSPDDLLRKTPEFAQKLFQDRLDGYFQSVYRYLDEHFGGRNPYLAEIQGHLAYVRRLLESGALPTLRRRPRSINARALRRILEITLADERPHQRTDLRRRRRQRLRRDLPLPPENFLPT